MVGVKLFSLLVSFFGNNSVGWSKDYLRAQQTFGASYGTAKALLLPTGALQPKGRRIEVRLGLELLRPHSARIEPVRKWQCLFNFLHHHRPLHTP